MNIENWLSPLWPITCGRAKKASQFRVTWWEASPDFLYNMTLIDIACWYLLIIGISKFLCKINLWPGEDIADSMYSRCLSIFTSCGNEVAIFPHACKTKLCVSPWKLTEEHCQMHSEPRRSVLKLYQTTPTLSKTVKRKDKVSATWQ